MLVAAAESAYAAVEPGLIAFRQSGVGIYTVEPGLPATLKLIYPKPAAYPTWQPGGLVLAVARADPPYYLSSSIVLINRQGQELKTVLSGAHLWSLDFSPDGKKIAYVCQDAVGSPVEICVVDIDTGDHEMVTDPADGIEAAGQPYRVSWSPAGDQIAYGAQHVVDCEPGTPKDIVCQSPEIAVVTIADGTTVLITHHFAECPDWSPDGNEIVFFDRASRTGEPTGIVVMPATGGTGRQVVTLDDSMVGGNYGLAEPRWSPDGSEIIFATDRNGATSGNQDIFIVSASGGSLTNSTKTNNSDDNPDWGSPVGTAGFQPDLEIGTKRNALSGNDVYNKTGKHQTKATNVAQGAKQVFWIALTNDGDEPDEISVKGSPKVSGFADNYLVAGTDVTSEIRAGTFHCGTDVCTPGKGLRIKVVVKVKSSAPVGALETVQVTATSKNDPTRKDVVKAKVNVQAAH